MKTKFAFGIVAALSGALAAGSAMAATDYVNDGVNPPRDYERETVSPSISADDRTVVMTDKVFDPREAALIEQETVNQYIFDGEEEQAASGNYKDEAARYR